MERTAAASCRSLMPSHLSSSCRRPRPGPSVYALPFLTSCPMACHTIAAVIMLTILASGPAGDHLAAAAAVLPNFPASSLSPTTTVLTAARKSPLFPNLPARCPAQCTCDTLIGGRKRVSCTAGGMTAIPTGQMDRETRVLLFSGSAERPNEAAIGRIFMDLPELQEIRITYSGLPMIGESTFWPGRELQLLDLSNNRIDRLRDSDFNPLSNLKLLNLSDNQLHDIPSASFRFLRNLTTLSLARNRITKLVPRMFYQLDHLEVLDLSDNPLSGAEITAVMFQDVGSSLKVLMMERCQIKSISHLTYQEMPGLRELHLSDNNLSFLGSYEFTSLSSLKTLHLDGNRLSVVRDNAFFGLRLTHLGLSRNQLTSLPVCAFCNLHVESLDLSSNRFSSFHTSLLRPLSLSLIALNAGSNALLVDPGQAIADLLSPLRKAQIVKISWNHLNDSLPDETFGNLSTSLHTLDLSQNQLSNISGSWFMPLQSLESLDLSYNLIHGLDPPVLMAFQSISSLKAVHLQNNPWICRRCRILPLLDWISSNSPAAYFNVCQKTSTPSPHAASSSSSSFVRGSAGDPEVSSVTPLSSTSAASPAGCVMCYQPEHLAGRALHTLTEADLEYCPDPRVPMRLTSSEPKLGLVLAVIMIIASCLVVVIAAVAYKFKQAAVYYTHEEERFCVSRDFSRRPKGSPNHHLSYYGQAVVSSETPRLTSCPHRHHHRNPLSLTRSCCSYSRKKDSVHNSSKKKIVNASAKKRSIFSLPVMRSSTLCSSTSTHSTSSCSTSPQPALPPSSSSSMSPPPLVPPANATATGSCSRSFASRCSLPCFTPGHSNAFTRRFTSQSYSKSPFKSPFKSGSGVRHKSSCSSTHSTSPLSCSSPDSSPENSPATVANATLTKSRIRF